MDAHERAVEQQSTTRSVAPGSVDHGWTVIVVRRGDFTGDALDRWLGELADRRSTPTYSNRRW